MFPVPNDSKRVVTPEEIIQFQKFHGFTDVTLAEFLGVTVQCVRLWLRNERQVTLLTSKVIRLMNKYPNLLRDF